MAKQATGFTIVELLIVIVVIAILASVSLVAYNGVAQRGRDSVRKQDVAEIIKMLGMRSLERSSTWIRSGVACNEEYNGWFTQRGTSLTGSWYGEKSASQCLAEHVGATVRFQDPKGADSCVPGDPDRCFAYMYTSCIVGDEYHTYIYAHLETQPTSSTATDGTCQSEFDSTWGMNYYQRFVTRP
jgi:prepilin-type N-terminal cleavage/methylation domain-containing protein